MPSQTPTFAGRGSELDPARPSRDDDLISGHSPLNGGDFASGTSHTDPRGTDISMQASAGWGGCHSCVLSAESLSSTGNVTDTLTTFLRAVPPKPALIA